MDRDLLKAWLDHGLSLPQIGALVGRAPSTVGYWVQKHGLVANGRAKYAPRGGLPRARLVALVQRGDSIVSIARQLDVSTSTVSYWLKRYGLPKPARIRRAKVDEALRNGSRTVVRNCQRHGKTEFAVVGSTHGLRCKACRAEAVARRRRRVKEILVTEAGGRCMRCGYDRCIAAFQFHHAEPDGKSFGIAQRGITRAIEKVREEARKCILLCANCHAEVEAGFTWLPVASLS